METFLKKIAQHKQICFIHMPKTAGSTFVDNAKKFLPKDNLILGYSKDQKKELSNYTRAELSQIKPLLLSAHLSYFEFKQITPIDVAFFSIVRHPVDRLFSYYLYSKRVATRNKVTIAAAENNFYNFLLYLEKNNPRILINQQCRFVATSKSLKNKLKLTFNEIEEILSKPEYSIFPIERCDLVFYNILKLLGCNELNIKRRKVSKNKPLEEITDQTKEYILKHNSADLNLYEHASIKSI